MRPFRHLTPRYIWNRTALIVYERANPGQPWLTPDMIKILDSWLCPADVGLEFGSGRSTSWFAARVKHLTSVEHNPEWYSLDSVVKGLLRYGFYEIKRFLSPKELR